jgi:Uncharacterized conserved protein
MRNCLKLEELPNYSIQFKPVSIEDREWITELTKCEDSRSADFCFGNIFMWDKTYIQYVGRIEMRLIAMPAYKEHPFFSFPIGCGSLVPVIDTLREHSQRHNFPFSLMGVTEEHRQELEVLYPGKFEFMEDRDHADYIYLAEKLATLSGKKLHGKRNHINRFIEDGNWSFEPMSSESAVECLAMLDTWTLESRDVLDVGLSAEHHAIQQAVEFFDALEMEGGILRRDGRLIAFTMGEKINSDTFNIHFEKAYPDIQGAYPMINREFVRHIMEKHPEIVYINREDDMGIENLRQAKMSYHPEFLVKKFAAVWKED